MKLKFKFFGKAHAGKFYPDFPDHLKKCLQSLEGKRMTVAIEEYFKNRTDKENRYYWGVIVAMIADKIGESREATHEILKTLFLREIIYKKIGKKMVRFEKVLSSASLKTYQFEKYCEDIRIWATQKLDLYIPNPNEVSPHS